MYNRRSHCGRSSYRLLFVSECRDLSAGIFGNCNAGITAGIFGSYSAGITVGIFGSCNAGITAGQQRE